ncbi:MAG: nucleotidyltransferase family protein [Deltaproteobacteria bacterium]|nr:nucleotidyltransferase family protein [Deltaproteobacteria bacterium]
MLKKLTDKIIIQTLKKRIGTLKRYGVKRIGLFGSFVRGEQRENSDIDFIVEFETPNFDNFMDLAFYLEDLFGRKVEILTPEGIRGIRIRKVAEDIERNAVYV